MKAAIVFVLVALGAALVLAEVPQSTIHFKWVGSSSDVYNFNNWSCFVVSESGEKRCDTNDVLNPFHVSTDLNIFLDASNLMVPLHLDVVRANEAKFTNGIFAVDNIDTTKISLDNANLIVKDQFKAEEVHIRSCAEDAEKCALEFDTDRNSAIQFESNPRVYGYGIVRFRKGLFVLTPRSVFQVSNVTEDHGLLDMSHYDPTRDTDVGLSLYTYNSIEFYRADKSARNGASNNSTSESCGTDHYYHRHMEHHFEENKHRSVEQGTCAPFGALACDNPTTRDRYASSTQQWTVGIVWHILSQTDGSQPVDAISGFSIPDSLAVLNDVFRPTNIRFVTRETRRIRNSNFYTIRDSNVYFNLWNQYNSNRGLARPRNIDIFIAQYPTTANGIINGEARFPWSRNPTINLVMAVRPGVVSRTFNTIAHEMGHVFGLWHTFQGSAWGCGNPCFEPVARNTANNNGDFCADTRATPNNNMCQDPGTRDCTNVAFGATPFRNLMGYAPQNCRNQFSVQQRSRMRCYIQQTFPSITA
jgi:hypothetical protein